MASSLATSDPPTGGPPGRKVDAGTVEVEDRTRRFPGGVPVTAVDEARIPLTDAAFVELVGDARVVALGENNHHIAEFGELRGRLVRVLVDELGFGVLALESGFVEGMAVDAWMRGDGGELPVDDGFTFRFGDAGETQSLLGRLRGRLRYAGLDIPGSGGDPAAALRYVRAALGEDDRVLADRALEATRAYAAANNGVAPQRYAALADTERDAATAAITRVLLRLDAIGAPPEVRHAALGALRLDEQLRELDAILGERPDGPSRTVSSRDTYMAETVRLLRERHGPDTRIVLLAHNGHLQRTPLTLLPGVTVRSCGTDLAAALGADYRAIGLTAIDGTTTAPRLDDDARHGIDVVVAAPLDPPAPDSVEAALAPVTGTELVDLRAVTDGPRSIRHATLFNPVDVAAAFDAMIVVPTMRPSGFVRRG